MCSNKMLSIILAIIILIYTPVEIAEKLSKYVYIDNRNLVLISDTDRGYTNSPYSHDNQEEIDVIWRYMQFDRPDGDELLNALKVSDMYQTHPRLWVKGSEIQTIADRINNDKTLKAKKGLLFAQCDNYLDKGPVVPTLVGIRLFGSCYSDLFDNFYKKGTKNKPMYETGIALA